jgi:predicted KAP-like P-loop ATPase
LASQLIGPKRTGGNPRLIKRFLNSLSIRRSLARAQSIPVDDALLAKLLMFEKFVSLESLGALSDMISASTDGKSGQLQKIENDVRAGKSLQDVDAPAAWKKDNEVIEPWLRLAPELSGFDLRGALHVGKESARIITSDDRLSETGVAVLNELLALTMAAQVALKTKVKALPSTERSLIMTKLLEKASAEANWGTPTILWSLETLAAEDASLATRLIAFLSDLPATTLTAALAVRMRGKPGGTELIDLWGKRTDLPSPVAKALASKKA